MLLIPTITALVIAMEQVYASDSQNAVMEFWNKVSSAIMGIKLDVLKFVSLILDTPALDNLTSPQHALNVETIS